MSDKDHRQLWESYSTHRENAISEGTGSGKSEAGWDARAGDRAKFNDPGHRATQQRMQADYDAQKNSMNQSDFSTNPDDENYDKVTHLLDQLVDTVMDYEATSEVGAIQSIKARLDNRGDFHEHGY